MGINHTHDHSHIRIKKQHFEDAANAMIEDDELYHRGGLEKGMNLKTVFSRLDWDAEFDKKTGDLINLETYRERPGGMEGMAYAIGPYVEGGSYIKMVAHTDGEIVFRWFFDGDECIEQELSSRGGIEIWKPEAAAKNTFKVKADIQSEFVFEIRAESQEDAERLLAKKLRNKMRAALEDGTSFMSTTRLKKCKIQTRPKKKKKASKRKSTKKKNGRK